MGGWKFGNTIDGCQAEYVLVPDAEYNCALIPPELSDEQVSFLTSRPACTRYHLLAFLTVSHLSSLSLCLHS